jgi:hypothetical protein
VPVNGSGLIFFLDAAGVLKGVAVWGLPPLPAGAEDGSAAEALATVDRVLGGVVDRAKEVLHRGLREGQVFKYDMNSRCVARPRTGVCRIIPFRVLNTLMERRGVCEVG